MSQEWDQVVPGCVQNGIPTIKCFEAVFANLVSVIVSLSILALFVMLIFGGFRYLTSKGNPETLESARNTIFYAIIGLIVIISSYIVLKAIAWFTGINLLKFEIPTLKP